MAPRLWKILRHSIFVIGFHCHCVVGNHSRHGLKQSLCHEVLYHLAEH